MDIYTSLDGGGGSDNNFLWTELHGARLRNTKDHENDPSWILEERGIFNRFIKKGLIFPPRWAPFIFCSDIKSVAPCTILFHPSTTSLCTVVDTNHNNISVKPLSKDHKNYVIKWGLSKWWLNWWRHCKHIGCCFGIQGLIKPLHESNGSFINDVIIGLLYQATTSKSSTVIIWLTPHSPTPHDILFTTYVM